MTSVLFFVCGGVALLHPCEIYVSSIHITGVENRTICSECNALIRGEYGTGSETRNGENVLLWSVVIGRLAETVADAVFPRNRNKADFRMRNNLFSVVCVSFSGRHVLAEWRRESRQAETSPPHTTRQRAEQAQATPLEQLTDKTPRVVDRRAAPRADSTPQQQLHCRTL